MTSSTELRALCVLGGEALAMLAILYVALEESNDEATENTMGRIKEWMRVNDLVEFFEQTRGGLLALRSAERN